MHYLSSGALGIAIFFSLITQCSTIHDAGAAKSNAPARPAATVELSMKDGFLTASQAGQDPISRELPDAKPYQIVTPGPPAIVTTCDGGLEVATVIAAPDPVRFANMLPILVDPPFAVLAELAVPDTTQNGRASLVDANGGVVWSGQDAMLLQPVVGELPGQMYMFATTPGSNPVLPMGEHSSLVLVNALTATEQWRLELATTSTPLDAQLLATDGSRGLLLLQYGFANFEFAVLDLASGELLQRWQLSGQVAAQMVYPGGFSRLATVGLDGHTASLVVLNLEETTALWSFNLAQLTLEQTPGKVQAYNEDENILPVGGAEIPAPGNQPFQQGILPTQHGSEWTIPALVDGNGRVLVVNGAGASWMGYN